MTILQVLCHSGVWWKKGVVPSQVGEACAHRYVLEEASQENVKSRDQSQVLDAHLDQESIAVIEVG